MSNEDILVELRRLAASIGDAHSGISSWNQLAYPLEFRIFEDEFYIINATKSLADML